MADSFIIKSVRSDATLEFSHMRQYRVNIALISEERKAVKDIYLDDGDTSKLASLFQAMAEQWRGWEGKLVWLSLDGDFALNATSDGLGHIELEVECSNYGVAEPWYFKGSLFAEAGQLDTLARDAKRFFNPI